MTVLLAVFIAATVFGFVGLMADGIGHVLRDARRMVKRRVRI